MCVWNGVYGHQVQALQKGVDVVVGTPGRIIDMLERKALKVTDAFTQTDIRAATS